MEEEENGALFCWGDVISKKDGKKLQNSLRDEFGIDLVKDAEISNNGDDILSIKKYDNPSVKITMDKRKKKATLEISDVPCYEFKVKEKNTNQYLYKIKKAYVLIKVKPNYAEEFCIMMIACKELCNRASESKKLAEIYDVCSVLGPYDFVLELEGVGKDEEKRNEKLNRTIFKIRENLGGYIYETCTLTQYDLLKILGDNAKKPLLLAEKSKFDKANNKSHDNKTPTNHVHVLVKVKPSCTEKFFLKMVLFNTDHIHENLARIDKVCSLVGPFDFLLKIRGEYEKIYKTILKIREIFGDFINETITIEKYKIPMTKEKLEKRFVMILGEKSLNKLPGRHGDKIPKESPNPDYEIDLKEIYDADTTSLKSLLKKPKTFLEIWELNKQIYELSNRVADLEKTKK